MRRLHNRHRRHVASDWRDASDRCFVFDPCSASNLCLAQDRRFACDPRVAEIVHVCRDVCENAAERSVIRQSSSQAGRSEKARSTREWGWTATSVRAGRVGNSGFSPRGWLRISDFELFYSRGRVGFVPTACVKTQGTNSEDSRPGPACLFFRRSVAVRFSYWTEKLRQRMAGLSRRRRVPHANPQAERCEERCLPSVSALLFTDSFDPTLQDLTILSDGPDDITVTVSGGNIQILVGQNGGVQTTLLGQPTIAPGLLARIDIFGSDATNRIDLNGVTTANGFSASLAVNVEAGDSNDLLDATSSDIAVSLVGGDGADTITGGTANDTLLGGDGADLITGGVGNDSLLGGNGADTVNGGVGLDTINGGDGADSLNAGDDNDSVFGANGADNIDGGLGDDTLNGDGGNDTINGNTGNDTLLGGADQDSLLGGAGNDSINAQAGNDTVLGEAGNDSVLGGDGTDSVLGGDGNDTISGDANNDTVVGNDGDDSLFGGAGNDQLFGDGATSASSGSGNDTILGQGGADTLIGGGGGDSLDGGDGDDVVQSSLAAVASLPTISISDAVLNEGTPPPLFNPAQSFPVGGGATSAIDDVTVNDFNGDGRPDIAAVTRNQSVRVMLNNGSGGFTAGGSFAIGEFSLGITSGDFNGDGRIDLAATNATDSTVSVLMGNGNGTFANQVVLSLPQFSFPWEIVAADVTGDGRLDLLTANVVGQSVSVFVNNGSGTFSSRVDTPTGANTNPHGLTARDLDGDGDLDVAVTCNSSAQVKILRNNGGTLSVSSTLAVGTLPESVVALDIDQDGDLDLAVSNLSNRNISILQNDGTATFTTTTNLPVQNGFVYDLAVGDFNQDSISDIVVGNSSIFDEVMVYLGNGNGTFQTRIDIQFSPSTNVTGGGIAVADLNGDGFQDLAGGSYVSDAVYSLINSGLGTNAQTTTLTVSLSQASSQTVTVNYTTADGLGLSTSDYQSAANTLTFAPGQTTQTITVRSRPDNAPEPAESFFVNLSSPTNATIGDAQGSVRLVDDDGGAVGPLMSITSSASPSEGNSGTTNVVLTVSLSAPSAQTITVNYAAQDITATANSDYVLAPGLLTFSPGVTSQTITVTVSGDTSAEFDELVRINLSNPTNVVLSNSQADVTIVNDDGVAGNPTLLGSGGNDRLIGSDANETLNGGSGNDSIDAGGGNDNVFGGSGNDTINGGNGNDTLNGQGGNDVVDGGAGDDQFVWTGASGASDTVSGSSGFDTAVVNGTGSADTFAVGQDASGQLTVTDSGFTLTVQSTITNVVINANGGDDVITIGSLSNVTGTVLTINGGDGNDNLDASGAVLGFVRMGLNGQAGDDTLTGGDGTDTLDGGDGNDVLAAGAGNDSVIGGAGDDVLSGQDGNDTLNGGDGDDNAAGGNGNDSVRGADGNDTLQGQAGNDTLTGETGDDSLVDTTGNDSLDGGNGFDTLDSGDGNDTLDGGFGDDSLTAGAGSDKLRGGDGNDTLDAGDGDDELNGGDGDDQLVGGLGNDGLSGGDGDDLINGGAGNDVITGNDGNDSLLGGSGADTLLGGDGDDSINGQGGADILAGNEGIDTLTADASDSVNEAFVLSQTLLDKLDGV